jgi:hypothetical protein
LRIAFGLTNVLCEVKEGNMVSLRPGVLELLAELKKEHTLILWTLKSKKVIKHLKNITRELFSFFDEVYCKEDIDSFEEIPGCSIHQFKHVDRIKADCMVECKKNYELYSNNLQIKGKYCIIDSYREISLERPGSWKIKMLGDDTLEKWESRVKRKEDWVFRVYEFIEKVKSDGTPSPSGHSR